MKQYRRNSEIVKAFQWNPKVRGACYCHVYKVNGISAPHFHPTYKDSDFVPLEEGDYFVVDETMFVPKWVLWKKADFERSFTEVNQFEIGEEILDTLRGFAIEKKAMDIEIPLIITLCGSTKFREEYRAANAELTHQLYIVLTCGCFKGDPEWGTLPKGELDELHKRKIDLCDAVVVLNVDNYIGDSTRSEIDYAVSCHIPVLYLNEVENDVQTRPTESRTLETVAGAKNA